MSEKRRYEKLNTDAYVEDHALIDEIAQKVGSRKEAIHVLSEVYRGKSPNIEGEKKHLSTFDTQPFSYNIKYGREMMPLGFEHGRPAFFIVYHCPKLEQGETTNISELPCFQQFDEVRLQCDEPCPFVTTAWQHNIVKRDFLLLRESLLSRYIQKHGRHAETSTISNTVLANDS